MNRKERLNKVNAIIDSIITDIRKEEVLCEQIKIEDNDFGKYDKVDATKVNCWDFSKKGQVRNEITLNLGNMVSGFPFILNGNKFLNSETAYISGIYSINSKTCRIAQTELSKCNNGLFAKKKFRYWDNEFTAIARTDWQEFNIMWMLYVVHCKVQTNEDFKKLLLSLPVNAYIIEDTSFQSIKRSPNKLIWGAENIELKSLRLERLKVFKSKLAEENIPFIKKYKQLLFSHICNYGTFEGYNIMGKILTYLSFCVKSNVQPKIDYELLNSKNIYLLGERMKFPKS